MSSKVLGQKDANAPIEQTAGGKDVKTMDYHRQMLQSKIQEPYAILPIISRRILTAHSAQKDLVSPSDNIMSPCSAKINALRNKHASKYDTPFPPSINILIPIQS